LTQQKFEVCPDIWEAANQILKESFTARDYNFWIKPLYISGISSGPKNFIGIDLMAPSCNHAFFIKDQFVEPMKIIFSTALDADCHIKVWSPEQKARWNESMNFVADFVCKKKSQQHKAVKNLRMSFEKWKNCGKK